MGKDNSEQDVIYVNKLKQRVDLENPRYDQETFVGRAKHFILITNPLNLFVTNKMLEEAKTLVDKYRRKEAIPDHVTLDELWRAKVLYDSAFHPVTGEKMFLIGRMSAQVPMNLMITTGMMIFYKGTSTVLFWQWLNQSFNALVNYTNRSGDMQQTNSQILTSYVCATGAAVGTALYLNSLAKSMPPVIGRLVPFTAVAAANCINIPLMRMQELRHGTPIYDENNTKLGYSTAAAKFGIAQVVFSRICMAVPGMVSAPIAMNILEKRGILTKYLWLPVPATLVIVGLCLTFATPLACAFFKQKSSISSRYIDKKTLEELMKHYGQLPTVFYYYKGL